MDNVVERMERWADRLPIEESIPIGENEKYEFIMRLHDMNYFENNGATVQGLLESLEKGTLTLHGHKVVVL